MSNLENDLIDLPGELHEDEELEAPKSASIDSLRILEALLFASDELLSTARLKAILPGSPDAREIGAMVERINCQLQKERHPFEVVEIGGGYQFKTIAYFHPWVRQIFKDKASKRLSIQALECLSIIAYRQPLSKAEIEAIRGVLSDGAMKTLLEKRLITITGRSEKPGRALLYGTTPEFLKYFGLNKTSDLPKIEEFEAMARDRMEHLPIDELKNAGQQSQDDASGEEAAIEIVLPDDKKTEAQSASGTASTDIDSVDAGIFEVAVQEKQTTMTNEPKEPVQVSEAETVLQRAVKFDDPNPQEPSDQPVVVVKQKKRGRPRKEKSKEPAMHTKAVPDKKNSLPQQNDEPVDQPDAEVALFEVAGTLKKESREQRASQPPDIAKILPEEETVIEGAVDTSKSNPKKEGDPSVVSENQEDEAVIETAVASDQETVQLVKDPEQNSAREQDKDDDALFEVKM